MIAPPPHSSRPSQAYPEESAKILLAALLSSHVPQAVQNLTASRTDANADGPPQLPMTITIDATTRIMGHCNTITVPSAERIAGVMTVAMKNSGVDGDGAEKDRKIDVKVTAGVEIRGCRNVVLAIAPQKKVGGQEGEEGAKGEGDGEARGEARKRRASSEPAEMPSKKEGRW